MTKAIGKAAMFGLTILWLPILVSGQENTGRIAGRVNDPSGAAVPGATVEARNTLTGVSSQTVTNSAGLYTFESQPIGTYTVSATATGFKKFEQTDVRLVSGTNATVNITLAVGSATQTVTVTGRLLDQEAPFINVQNRPAYEVKANSGASSPRIAGGRRKN
jgi:hypothetical protein